MESSFNGNASVAAPDAVYEYSFGKLPNHTTYIYYPAVKDTDPMMAKSKIDIRENAIPERAANAMEMKALYVESNLFATSTNYSATSGSVPALMPIWWDTGIIDTVKKECPLYSGLIKHVSNRGLFADWTNQTTRTAAVFTTEGAALGNQDPAYTHYSYPMKYAYATKEAMGPMIAGSSSFVNVLTELANDAYQALAELIEIQICSGTSNNGSSSGFSGFTNLVTTNYTNRSSAVIRLQDLDTAIDTLKASYPASKAYKGQGLFVTDPYTWTAIAKLIQPYQWFAGASSIAFGIESVSYRGIPIVTSNGMYTTTNSREVNLWDLSVAELRVLMEPTMMPLAIDRDSYKFTVKTYLTLIIKAQTFCYRIYGVT